MVGIVEMGGEETIRGQGHTRSGYFGDNIRGAVVGRDDGTVCVVGLVKEINSEVCVEYRQ